MTRLTEDELIASLFAPIAGAGALGLRDDAAVIAARPGCDLVVTKDMLVAGAHFFAEDPPDAIARKALRVNLSDLAAKGATPQGFLLGLALPQDWTQDWLEAFARGLGEDSRHFACPLLGGDTVATPGPLSLSITAFGDVPAGRMVPRTGLRGGDRLYVSGTIGDAALGLRLRQGAASDAGWIGALSPIAAAALRERYLLPRPRLALRPALRAHARAAMDISDGLAGDLDKMLRLEGLSAEIDVSRIPLSDAVRAAIAVRPALLAVALTGGDDYELLCAVPFEQAASFEKAAAIAAIGVAAIGVVRLGAGGPVFRDGEGAALTLTSSRFSHF